MNNTSASSHCKVVVLISGNGSNLQALIDGQEQGHLPIHIVSVISNIPEAAGLRRAVKAGIPQYTINHQDFTDREAFDTELSSTIDQYQPDLVVLAGFMRILTSDFTRHYQGRMLNIHPSLLPKYQGLHTHQRVLDAGDDYHGASVHFVTEKLDGGPTVIQAIVPVLKDDNATSLAKRVQLQEHIIYPMAVKWFARQQLELRGNQVLLNHSVLPDCGYQIKQL
ncbi:phosphoribosylglycinamide formyltransferase [Candidatus Endobugula sertula]|uniref:Phosphoribosylglycinamide formyltransferase n=1 Tax=Candidatus Endobugula sertula TaxID=62101 RepID=A0A1D2QTS3_9GAMM|nr:phosphoribosylglycinamide formyltransferase [Candidatus Endobugula sertula]